MNVLDTSFIGTSIKVWGNNAPQQIGINLMETKLVCESCAGYAECALCDGFKGVCADCCDCGNKYSDWVESAVKVTFTFSPETFEAVKEFLEMRGGLAGINEALDTTVCAGCFTENCDGGCE